MHTIKKLSGIVCLSLLAGTAMAQVPEDVLKYSWGPTNQSARINAVGGAMGALGGDISALYSNPAGLGFYKTTDIVVSPGFNFLKNKGNFRGTDTTSNESKFGLGPTGVVFGWPKHTQSKWRSSSFSIGVNRTVNFNNKVAYTGYNDFSSFGEVYAAEAAARSQQSGETLEDMLYNKTVSYGAQMGIYTYLIDPIVDQNGETVVGALSQYDLIRNGGDFYVKQDRFIETSGGITDLALGFASNYNDKVYIGGSLGIPIVNYERRSILRETDATGNTTNNFDFAELRETNTTRGAGFNLKLGTIFKPTELVRIGVTVHTPTWYSLTDGYDGSMSVNTEGYASGTREVNVTRDLNSGQKPTYKYELVSPWRFMVSGAYVLHEVEDVSKQRGFITADIEYVTHKSNKFRGISEEDGGDGYEYSAENGVIKDYYKNAFNFRLGGELKFTTLMTRLGFAYYGNPYADKALKANQMFISGGLGYRNKGFFVDLTYVHALQKDVSFPYRLSDKANTFANLRGTGSNISLTFGIKI